MKLEEFVTRRQAPCYLQITGVQLDKRGEIKNIGIKNQFGEHIILPIKQFFEQWTDRGGNIHYHMICNKHNVRFVGELEPDYFERSGRFCIIDRRHNVVNALNKVTGWTGAIQHEVETKNVTKELVNFMKFAVENLKNIFDEDASLRLDSVLAVTVLSAANPETVYPSMDIPSNKIFHKYYSVYTYKVFDSTLESFRYFLDANKVYPLVPKNSKEDILYVCEGAIRGVDGKANFSYTNEVTAQLVYSTKKKTFSLRLHMPYDGCRWDTDYKRSRLLRGLVDDKEPVIADFGLIKKQQFTLVEGSKEDICNFLANKPKAAEIAFKKRSESHSKPLFETKTWTTFRAMVALFMEFARKYYIGIDKCVSDKSELYLTVPDIGCTKNRIELKGLKDIAEEIKTHKGIEENDKITFTMLLRFSFGYTEDEYLRINVSNGSRAKRAFVNIRIDLNENGRFRIAPGHDMLNRDYIGNGCVGKETTAACEAHEYGYFISADRAVRRLLKLLDVYGECLIKRDSESK